MQTVKDSHRLRSTRTADRAHEDILEGIVVSNDLSTLLRWEEVAIHVQLWGGHDSSSVSVYKGKVIDQPTCLDIHVICERPVIRNDGFVGKKWLIGPVLNSYSVDINPNLAVRVIGLRLGLGKSLFPVGTGRAKDQTSCQTNSHCLVGKAC